MKSNRQKKNVKMNKKKAVMQGGLKNTESL